MSTSAPLPSEQWGYDDLPELSEFQLHQRREGLFLLLAGLFLGTLAMLNILGITRFIDLSFTIPGLDVTVPMTLAVGVLPYPITFLCTDFISELYGRRRANQVVGVGFVLNLWVLGILWLGGALPGTESPEFFFVRTSTFAAVGASMFAYLAAQLVDVQVFHFWKNLTRGRHLWLRNNGSTLVSQLVDSTAVIVGSYWAAALPINADEPLVGQLVTFILSSYVFKLVAAMVDTLPFYLGTHHLSRYLRLPPPGRYPARTAAAAVEAGVG